MDFVALDFETASPEKFNACEIGLSFVENGRIVATKSWFIKPPCYPNFYKYFNNITPLDVAKSPQFPGVWKEIYPLIEGKFVLMHNAPFDIEVLCTTLVYYGLPLPNITYGCTLQIARIVFPGRKRSKNIDKPYGLAALCKTHKITFNHHHAGEDARACAELALKMFEKHGIFSVEDIESEFNIRIGRLKATGERYRPYKKGNPKSKSKKHTQANAEEQRQQNEQEQQNQEKQEEQQRQNEERKKQQQEWEEVRWREEERKREKQKAEEHEALHAKKDDRKQLEILLQKVEYFHSRATTPGERLATGAAIERIKQKLYSFSETKPSVEAQEQKKTERNSSQAEGNLREAERQWRQAEETRLEREKQERAERRKEQWQKWRQWQQEFEGKYENYLVVATVGLVTLLLVIGLVGLRVVAETGKAKKELAITTELWRESENMLATKKNELEEQKRREEEERQRLLAEKREREETDRKEQEFQRLVEQPRFQEREAAGCGCCSGGVVAMAAVMAYPCYCTAWWLATLMF